MTFQQFPHSLFALNTVFVSNLKINNHPYFSTSDWAHIIHEDCKKNFEIVTNRIVQFDLDLCKKIEYKSEKELNVTFFSIHYKVFPEMRNGGELNKVKSVTFLGKIIESWSFSTHPVWNPRANPRSSALLHGWSVPNLPESALFRTEFHSIVFYSSKTALIFSHVNLVIRKLIAKHFCCRS